MTRGARAASANNVSVDEESLRRDIKNLVGKTIEETLNPPLEEVASSSSGPSATRERRAGRPTAAATTPESSSPGPGRSKQVRGDARCAQGGVPGARHRRCTVHFYRNVLRRVPVTRRKAAARMLKTIHAKESREVCVRKAEEVTEELESMRLGAAARTVRDGLAETLACTEFPPEHWRRIRTNNRIERINREIRRRTRAVGTFPDGNSTLMLATVRLKYIVEHEWGKRRYLDMSTQEEMDEPKGKAKG